MKVKKKKFADISAKNSYFSTPALKGEFTNFDIVILNDAPR